MLEIPIQFYTTYNPRRLWQKTRDIIGKIVDDITEEGMNFTETGRWCEWGTNIIQHYNLDKKWFKDHMFDIAAEFTTRTGVISDLQVYYDDREAGAKFDPAKDICFDMIFYTDMCPNYKED